MAALRKPSGQPRPPGRKHMIKATCGLALHSRSAAAASFRQAAKLSELVRQVARGTETASKSQ